MMMDIKKKCKYLIDTNTFIDSCKIHYPFGTFPSYWSWFENEITKSDSKICLISHVYNELIVQHDELATWVKNKLVLKRSQIDGDVATQEAYKQLMEWFSLHNKTYYADAVWGHWVESRKADPYLIATAKSHDMVIVSEEKHAPMEISRFQLVKNCNKEPKIPDVCQMLKVPCISLIELQKQLKLRL